jgi:hypothetical protein
MLTHNSGSLALLCSSLHLVGGLTHAQDLSPEDANVMAIRKDPSIDASGEQAIGRWVEAKVAKLATAAADPEADRQAAYRQFRRIFRDYCNRNNSSAAFRTQLATQTTAMAHARFAETDLDPTVAWGLAQALVDMNRPDTFTGLAAGLESPVEIARYLCAKGLAALKDRISEDKDTLATAIQALRQAALAETSPVVLGRLYEALNYQEQVADVFDAYLAIFDKRLAFRRGPAVIVDGAEYHAYEFFRASGVLGRLSTDQRVALVQRLAVFLRLDAQRYSSQDLEDKRRTGMRNDDKEILIPEAYTERKRIEMLLDGAEEILAAVVGSASGNIREELRVGGYVRRAEVLEQAYRWVGNPENQVRGALNEAPWNVALGAP